jgi:hypothetical protein
LGFLINCVLKVLPIREAFSSNEKKVNTQILQRCEKQRTGRHLQQNHNKCSQIGKSRGATF